MANCDAGADEWLRKGCRETSVRWENSARRPKGRLASSSLASTAVLPGCRNDVLRSGDVDGFPGGAL